MPLKSPNLGRVIAGEVLAVFALVDIKCCLKEQERRYVFSFELNQPCLKPLKLHLKPFSFASKPLCWDKNSFLLRSLYSEPANLGGDAPKPP